MRHVVMSEEREPVAKGLQEALQVTLQVDRTQEQANDH